MREITFTFYNDALYQVTVNYDRDRTEGLTNSDLVEALSTVYGAPMPAAARTRTSPPVEGFPDGIVVARWENADSLLTLIRGSYTPEFQLIPVSKSLTRVPGQRPVRQSGWMRSKHRAVKQQSARKRLGRPAPLATRRASLTKRHFVLS